MSIIRINTHREHDCTIGTLSDIREIEALRKRNAELEAYLCGITDYFDKYDEHGNYHANLGECEKLLEIRDLEQQAKVIGVVRRFLIEVKPRSELVCVGWVTDCLVNMIEQSEEQAKQLKGEE